MTLLPWLTLVLVLVLALHPAQAQRIHAGAASGSYTNDFCPKVAEAVQREYFRHECVTSQGTSDNLRRVLGDPTSIGIGQLDVLAEFIESNPGQLTVVDPEIGLECLFAATRSRRNLARLTALPPDTVMALPPERSGSYASFRFLSHLEPALSALRVRHHDDALAAVESVIDGDSDIAFFVQAANIDNPVFRAISDADLAFIPVISREILRREAAGIQVYEPLEVPVTRTLFGFGPPRRVVTICTPVVLFTGNPTLFPAGSDARTDQETLIRVLTTVEQPEANDGSGLFPGTVELDRDRLQSLF